MLGSDLGKIQEKFEEGESMIRIDYMKIFLFYINTILKKKERNW